MYKKSKENKKERAREARTSSTATPRNEDSDDANLLSRTPICSLGCQFALLVAHSLFHARHDSSEASPHALAGVWLGEPGVLRVAVLLVLCMCLACALSFPSTVNASLRSPRHLCVCKRVYIYYLYVNSYILQALTTHRTALLATSLSLAVYIYIYTYFKH